MAATDCENGCVHASSVTGQPLISCPPQCWKTYRGSRPGPAEHEEDLTDEEDHLPELIATNSTTGGVSVAFDGWTKKQKKNFLRKDRKRKQVARDSDAQDVNAKETKKLLAAEKKKANGLTRILTDTRWHVSLAQDGMRLASNVLMLFLIPLAVSSCLLRDLADEINDIPLSQFQPMGGQPGMWCQTRRQYQFPANNSNLPSSQLLVMLKSFMALCGWHIVRAMFCIVGGSHQFMHMDRGHYHSISLFVCIVARRVRFGRRGGEDFEVFMNAGDVLCFNGLVWHSGLQNDADSCVVFMYFDRQAFYLTQEMTADKNADQSRFGFTKMYSELEWQQYSASFKSDPDEYDCVTLAHLEMLPIRLMRALVPASEFTLDT